MLQFFNAKLKSDSLALNFIAKKPSLRDVASTLWDIKVLQALNPSPTAVEFENIIRKKGIQEALSILKNTLQNDSSTNLMQGFVVNRMGYTFLNEKKYKEAIGIFKLNTELHADNPNWFDSLAEAYELFGDKDNMKTISQHVLDMFSKKSELTNNDKAIKQLAEDRLRQ